MTRSVSIKLSAAIVALFLPLNGSWLAYAQPVQPCPVAQVERNVIYGMYSGLALLLDVYRPEHSNERGILFVPGSGWAAPSDPGATPLKDEAQQVPFFTQPLLRAGYTVFVVNHRASPQFHYPSQVGDVARAVRFIRHNSARFGIDPGKLGAVGYSSGANLVAMLATHAEATRAIGKDPVSGENARIYCAVGVATPTDLTVETIPQGMELLSTYVGLPLTGKSDPGSAVSHLLAEASPITHVEPDDAPMLFIHGTVDPLVPLESVRRMASALTRAGVATKLIEIDGASHWPQPSPPGLDLQQEIVRWLNRFLISQ